MTQYLIIAAIVVWALLYSAWRLARPGNCGACSTCSGCGKPATPAPGVIPIENDVSAP